MVTNNFYAEFYADLRPAIQEIERLYGPLYLAVVLRIDESGDDHWVLLLGSQPLSSDLSRGMANVARILATEVPEEASRRIRRIGILRKSDPVVEAFSKGMTKPDLAAVQLKNVTLHGLDISNAGLFVTSRGSGKRKLTHRRKPLSNRN